MRHEKVREKTIEKYLVDNVKKKLKGKAYKWVSPGNRGVPDRIVFLPDGRIEFIELKAPGEKPTELQLKQHKNLAAYGINVLVIDSKDKIDEYIEQRGGASA